MLKKLLNGYEEKIVEDAARTAISMVEQKIQRHRTKKSINGNFNGRSKNFNRSSSSPRDVNKGSQKANDIYRPKGF